jgi:putative endonuclease
MSFSVHGGIAVRLRSWLEERLREPTFGERGERAAAKHLRHLGYALIATRRRHRYGEIDIIAVDGRTVVFVEVKTRRSEQFGRPAEAIDATRQARLTRAALAFLKSHGLLEYACRFDVIEVIWPEGDRRPTLRHLIDAFPAAGKGQFYN